MRLYIGDFLRDTQSLATAEEVGAFVLLMVACWSRGEAIEGDDARLARLARVSPDRWRNKVKNRIAPLFKIDGLFWRLPAIESQLADARKRQEKARLAALARHHGGDAPSIALSRDRGIPDRCSEQCYPEEKVRTCGGSLDYPASGSGVSPSKASTVQTTTTRQNREKSQNDPARGNGPYTFEGRVIKLVKKDFDQWTEAFPRLDLRAELVALDAWLAAGASAENRKRWFVVVSGALAKKNAERRPQTDDEVFPPGRRRRFVGPG